MRPSALIVALLVLLLAAAANASGHSFRVEGKELKTGEIHKIAEGNRLGTFKLLATPFGIAAHIVCKKNAVAANTSQIEGEGKSIGTAAFEECEVVKPANCRVKEPITTPLRGTLIEAGGTLNEEVKAQSGEIITTLSLEGASCPIKEPFSVTGTQICNLPGIGTEAINHTTECHTTGSKLKLGGKAGTFEGTEEEIRLEGKPNWSGV